MFCDFQLKGPDICIMTRRSGVMGYDSIYTTRKDAKRGNEICTQSPESMMLVVMLKFFFFLLDTPGNSCWRSQT
jgi:hypothetical protein